jgi:hypothetical protein
VGVVFRIGPGSWVGGYCDGVKGLLRISSHIGTRRVIAVQCIGSAAAYCSSACAHAQSGQYAAAALHYIFWILHAAAGGCSCSAGQRGVRGAGGMLGVCCVLPAAQWQVLGACPALLLCVSCTCQNSCSWVRQAAAKLLVVAGVPQRALRVMGLHH